MSNIKKQMKKYTHVGYVVGIDARTPEDYKLKCYLRETRCYWITKDEIKYSKINGHRRPRIAWPAFKLDLDSIKKI